jgi:hypothetical protein
MSDAAVTAGVEVVDGIVNVSAKVDVVEVMKQMAAQSSNTVDDMLVKLVEMARNNLDWKGAAVEFFKSTP